jgi:nicotinate phosphoribosyltransferase
MPGFSDHEAAFHATFRENPFGGEFTVACGLTTVIDFLAAFHFDETEIDYLVSHRGNDGKPLFSAGFLEYSCEPGPRPLRQIQRA